MTNYVTRIELRGSPSGEDYQALHDAMEAKGFVRTITGDDGKTYKLPNAMYYVSSNLSTSQICTAANEAANSVWTSCRVFSCEAPSSSWNGLDVA